MHQYRTLMNVQQTLVENGWHPAVAGKLVRRAADKALASGLGCDGNGCCDCQKNAWGGLGIQQTRSLRRDLNPTIAPRQMVAGDQCVRLAEIPGNETALYQQLDEYRNRGWNILETPRTHGFPSVAVYWACPPGRTPMESTGSQVLQSRAWGAPLYVREKF
jgi:hypothetical protein